MDESKLLRIVQKIVDRQVLLREKELEKIDAIIWEPYNEFALEFYFKPGVKRAMREIIMDDAWRQIYDYMGIAVALIDRTQKIVKENKETTDGKYELIKKFMKTTEFEGICGFWIDEEVDDYGKYWVYIVIDLNYLNRFSFYRNSVVEKMKIKVKNQIKTWLGLDVMVGSIAKHCEEI